MVQDCAPQQALAQATHHTAGAQDTGNAEQVWVIWNAVADHVNILAYLSW